ncbi:phosphate-binding protein [Corynebacterium phocae]|uniref:Phosphate-binding protein n=1 Tax=Corynebacterium phocae TaxID=161895 RepID=A0A1L7D1R1_9CORY|nr:phosphate ABC transporter substrate-binding protein PstS [Corynebacterium phocae]APT91962.1 phosphate-binding protein [Corynebacterium phocae]KAA8726955.1 phosphate ABC transporter substrate-binding protein PstS [Corynebacterium phocae]
MIRNFKRTAAIFGLVAATSTALVACNETSGSTDGDAVADGNGDLGGTLVGEGASSQQNAMDVFGIAFQEAYPNATLSYTPSGSGAGIESFINGTAMFAGSDSPLKKDQPEKAKERCGGNDAWHLPSVIGPVAIAYNLPGSEGLNLSVDTVAKIFKGEITKWDDAAIKAENEGVDLPSTDINVVYRSDESGTSANFQKFLAAATGAWDGEGKQFPQEVGAGANGSSGVATEVSSIEGAITYVEAGFAKDLGLGIANIDFGNGPVELNDDSVGKALDNLAFEDTGSEHNMVVDADALFASDGEGSYPLILTTYNIVCSAGYDEETSKLVKAFFTTVLDNQNDDLAARGFIPVSGGHADRLKAAIDAVA